MACSLGAKAVAREGGVDAVVVVAGGNPVGDLFDGAVGVVHRDGDTGQLEHADVVRVDDRLVDLDANDLELTIDGRGDDRGGPRFRTTVEAR